MSIEKTDWKGRRIPWRFAPLVVILLVLAAGYALGCQKYLTLEALAESRAMLQAGVAAHPVLAPAAFILLYTAAVAVAFPAASLLTIVAGFLFGWLMGGVLVLFAATAGATLLFLAARTACRDFLKERVSGRAARLAQGFEEGAFGYLLVLRLAPVLPFWLVNIAPALFNVKLKTYVSATALGIMPATFAYAYLGHGLESVLLMAESSGSDLQLSDLVTRELTVAFFALAIVAAISLVVKRMRKARLP